MNFTNFIPLEDRANIKIAITICTNNNEIIQTMKNKYSSVDKFSLGKKSIKAVENLKLPKVLSDKLKKQLHYTFVDSVKFSNYLYEIAEEEQLYLNIEKLYWSSEGAIDSNRVVRDLIKSPALSILFRYKLACHYIIESQVSKLWRKLSEKQRNNLLFRTEDNIVYYLSAQQEGQAFRIVAMKNNNNFKSINELAVICGISEGSVEFVKYYWKKISRKQRRLFFPRLITELREEFNRLNNESLRSKQCNELHTKFLNEIIAFLFSDIDKETFEIFLHKKKIPSYILLKCSLEWKFREKFLDILDYLQPFTHIRDFISIRNLINANLFEDIDLKDDFYVSMLIYWWKRSSDRLKEIIQIYLGKLALDFMTLNEKRWVFLILNEFTPIMKGDLLFTTQGLQTCRILANQQNWSLLGFIIYHCIIPEILDQFKLLLFDDELNSDADIVLDKQELDVFINGIFLNQEKDIELCWLCIR